MKSFISNGIKFQRTWAMPSAWTFTIPPIKKLLGEELYDKKIILDPFAGESSPATITNDLNPKRPTNYHMDAIDFLKMFPESFADVILFDPPYSPRQVKECYEGIGIEVTAKDTQMSFWSSAKNEIARICKSNGKVICFGWNSMGIGKNRGFELNRILMVPHGGAKNDTNCHR